MSAPRMILASLPSFCP